MIKKVLVNILKLVGGIIVFLSQMDFLDTSTINTDLYKYIAIGWGDKGFYLNTPTWDDLTVSTALKAAFGISGTAIHATYHREMIENELCKKISISKEQYRRLIAYIYTGLEQDAEGNLRSERMPLDSISRTHYE